MKNEMKNKKKEIEKIIEDIKTVFPFKGYIEKASDFGKEIALIIRNYLSQNAKILDFGCGPCDKTALFRRMGYKCYACDDLNDGWHEEGNNREIIKEFAKREGISFFHIRNNEIPFDNEYFDGILILDVIEHLHYSPHKLLTHLISKLRSEGYLFIGVPNAVNLRKRISVLFGRTNYVSLEKFYFSKEPWRGHVREYTLQEMIKVLRFHGMKVVYVGGPNIFMRHKIKNTYLQAIYSFVTRIFPGLSEAILVVGQKT